MQALRKAWASPTVHRAVQVLWVGLIVIFVCYYIWRNWTSFRDQRWQFNVWWGLVALVWAAVRKLLGGLRWALIALYDHETYTWPNVVNHMQVYFLSNLADYIPGGVWQMISRVQMSKGQGLSTLRASVSVAYEMGILVWSGCLIGAYVAAIKIFHDSLSVIAIMALMISLSLLIIHPTVAGNLLRLGLRLLKRPSTQVTVTFNWGLELLLLSIGVWITGGLTQFYLLKAFDPALPHAHLVYITSASALAWTIGFLTPWAPSGLGIRDGLLAWLLEVFVSAPLAVVATIAGRLAVVVEDILWASVALLLPRG